MSFRFNWRFFDVADLRERTRSTMTEAISKSKRPPIMVTPLKVEDIDFGTSPPHLAFQSINQVTPRRAHVVFALKYSGSASIALSTRIEGNPLREPLDSPEFPAWVKPQIIGADASLILPFSLKLHDIQLDALVDVVYTPHGLCIQFRGDPLRHIAAASSLDMIPGVNQMISEILRIQLSESFDEDIPETVWEVTHGKPPDPALGPRRWGQKHVEHVRLASLGVSQHPLSMIEPFNTLSLRDEETIIPHSIISRHQLPEVTRDGNLMRIDDILEPLEPASPASEPRKPRRRVIRMSSLAATEDESAIESSSPTLHPVGSRKRSRSSPTLYPPKLRDVGARLSHSAVNEKNGRVFTTSTAIPYKRSL